MKCFQIEIKYINENEQPVVVTIVSDPIPIVTDINKDNENEVIADVLNYIYDNPEAQGHNELMSVLENATSMNQINMYDRPLNYSAEKGLLDIPRKELSPYTLQGMFNNFPRYENINLFANAIKAKEADAPFKVNVNTFSANKRINAATKKLVNLSDADAIITGDLLTAYYDKENNTFYISDGKVDLKDFQKAAINYLIAGKYKDSIEDIVTKDLDFNPLDIFPASNVNSLLNILSSFKPDTIDEDSFKSPIRIVKSFNEPISSSNISTFEEVYPNYQYVGKIDGEDVKTFANPFITNKELDWRNPVAYWLWLNDVNFKAEIFGPKALGDAGNGTYITDFAKEQKKFIDNEVTKGNIFNKQLTIQNSEAETQDNDLVDAKILQTYLNNKRNPGSIKSRTTKFINKLKGLASDKEFPAPSLKSLSNLKGVDLTQVQQIIDNINDKIRVKNYDKLLPIEMEFLSKAVGLDVPTNFSDFLANFLPEENVDKSAKKKSNVKVGDIVEYAGNEYLLWSVNSSGKAKLLKPDGSKYTGTPDISKLSFVDSTAPFTFNESDYTSYGNHVISLKTGNKIKQRNILEMAALNKVTKLFSKDTPRFSKRVTNDTVTYASNDVGLYNSHKSFLRQIGANADGIVTRFNEANERGVYELEQSYYDAIAKFGKDAVGRLKYFDDGFGKRGASFKMATPVLSNMTSEELKVRDLREQQFKSRLLNAELTNGPKQWEDLSDYEKESIDKDRYTKELIDQNLGQPKWTDDQGYDRTAKEYFKYSDTLTAQSVLETMFEAKGRPFAQWLMNDYSELLKGVNIQLSAKEDLAKSGEDIILGYYQPGSKKIVMADFKSTDKNAFDDTLLHEILHAITYEHLRKDTSANKEFKEIYEMSKELLPDSYPLSDIDEFLTGIYTDREFQKQLQRANVGEKTLFGKIFDFFSKILNFDPSFKTELQRLFQNNFNLPSTKQTLFDRAKSSAMSVMSEIENIEDTTKPKARNQFRNNVNKSFRTSEDYANGAVFSLKNDVSVGNYNKASNDYQERTNVKKLGDYLSATYGLPIEFLNSNEIDSQYSKGGIQYGRHRAFVEDGTIVLNSDYATMGEPIHELSHLILDGLKVTNRTVYDELLALAKTHPTFNYVRRVYPELTGDQLAEETFTTIVGERYSESNEPQSSVDWNAKNETFFNKLFKAVKNFFAELFGIDSYRFHNMQDKELMNLDLNTIIDSFSKKVLNGDFIKEVDVATRKQGFMKGDGYLKAPDGGASSLYASFLSLGIDPETASKLWMKSKTQNFYDWHKGDLVEEFDGEPRVFYRGEDSNTLYNDPLGNGEPVVVRGNGTLQEVAPFKYKASSNDIKSIYNLDNGSVDSFRYTGGVENFATLNGIKMIGTPSELKYSISKLKEIFGDYTFAIQNFGDVSYLEHYKSPIAEVAELRNFLLKNNSIKIC